VELRPYQEEVVDLIVSSDEDRLIQAPTGSGKTIVFSKCLQVLAARGLKCLVLAHRGELIRQAKEKLKVATGLDCGVFSAYLKSKVIEPLTVASIQSLARYKGELDFDVVIIDEAHRVPDSGKESQYGEVLNRLEARLIGFTATPYRLDSGEIYGKGQWWGKLDYSIPLRQLIDEGYLVDYSHKVAICTKKIRSDLKKVKKTAGEYNEKESSELMSQKENLHSIINVVDEEMMSIVVFCVSIDHAKALDELLKEKSSIVHSGMTMVEREQNLEDFDLGKTRWMLNVGVLTEGWDCPRVDAVVLARPTKSTALYVQMVGRALRTYPGKEKATIYDIAGNYEEFGFVDDPKINENQGDGTGEAKPKVCPDCFEVVPANLSKCECGYEFVSEKEDKEADEEDDTFEMKELSINDNPNFGDVVRGYAEFYESKKGTPCLKVSYWHTGRTFPITHFYPTNKAWIGTKLAGIAKKGRPSFKEKYLSPARFMKAVNGGHIFPINGVMVKKDGEFEKISTL
jgi:DNA repair protein RadD